MSNYESRFWSWFERVVLPGLARLEVPEAAVIDEIDQRIRGMGLSWELGPAPDGSKSWAFAVSFSADLGLLPSAQALADAAPSMAGCQVLVGKPPKQWNGILNLPTPDGVASFSTANWWCYILPMDGGMAIMVSPAGVDEDVAEETVLLAADIAVQSELGELRYANLVKDISIIDSENAGGMPGIRCQMRELGSTPISP